jgi:putative phage-type endonuclease
MEKISRKVFPFTNEADWLALRVDDLTSTDMSALFGISPYMSPFELWHRKHNKTIGGFEPSDRMRWGNRLQNSIAEGIAEDKQWTIRQMKEYIRIPELKIGSSFDFCLMSGSGELLEIKNVDSLAFKEGWEEDEDGNIEAPVHIELQIQNEMLVSGISKAYIGALVGGNRTTILERTADKSVHDQIIARAKQFWLSIEANQEPAPDFKRDADFIKSLYQKVNPETTMISTEKIDSLTVKYKDASEIEKQAKENKDAIKAELLTLIGETEKVKGDKFTISAGYIGPCHMEYERAGYRNMKISWKKEKANVVK